MNINSMRDNVNLKSRKLNIIATALKLIVQALVLSVFSQNLAYARGEIYVINSETIEGTPSSYTAKNKYGQLKTYEWGLGNNLKITGFEYSDETFEYKNIADRVVIRRVDNDYSSGTSCSLFAQRIGSSKEKHAADYPDDGAGTNNCDMAVIMGGRTINIGALDVFANGPNPAHPNNSGSYKNIERVDFIFTAGIKTPNDTNDLSQAGHVVTEKSGNNPVKIAAILSLDPNGEPASYGPLVRVHPNETIHSDSTVIRYGKTNVRTTNNFLSNSLNGSAGGAGWIGRATENLGMAFVSLEDLGVAASATYYGFSYFGDDMTAAYDLTDPSTFPLDTPIDSGRGTLYSPGQADMYGGVAGYFENICLKFSGDVSEVTPALNSQITTGDSIYIASRTISPSNGHLKAYAMQANGSIASTATWDAGTLMTKLDREAKLYTTSNANDSLILFTNADSSVFNRSGSDPTASEIKDYTMNPSHTNGSFLGGRASGSFLGAISRGNDTALLTQSVDISRYLADSDYQTFQKNTIASRPKRVLVNSDDGFLYAFNTSGALTWGWMPGSLLAELKDYNNFPLNEHMKGTIDLVDAKDSGSYATYVVGSYLKGLGHYSLKLTSSGDVNSSSFVWDTNDSSSFDLSSNNGDMNYFEDSTGNTYAVYILTSSANVSTIMIRNIADASDTTTVSVNFHITSTPYVMPNFKNNNAPAGKTLYVGDSLGNIHAVPLLVTNAGNSVIDSAYNLTQNFNDASNIIGTLGSSEPILFLGASTSTSNAFYYLRAQSTTRITLLQYKKTSSSWNKRWTSYVTGAGSWASNGTTYTVDNSGAPTDTDNDGFFTNVGSGIQSLPANATITDAAVIVADTVALPISVDDPLAGPAGLCTPPKAYYYLYKLTEGKFPTGKYFKLDGVSINDNIIVGYGEPNTLITSDVQGNEKMLGIGNSDQDTVESTRSFYIHDSISTGIRGWQEIGR